MRLLLLASAAFRALALMAAPSRADRLHALQSLRSRMPHCTQSALAAMLEAARGGQLPAQVCRRADIREARDAMCQRRTRYGTIHQHVELEFISGGRTRVEMQSPQAMLYELTQSSQSFSAMLERAYDKHGSTVQRPWGLILYNDEITPGNQLRQQNPRKFEGFYWTLAEFGMENLCDEEAWLECLILQSSIRKRNAGGLSAVTAAVIKAFFTGEHDMRLAGITLVLFNGRSIHIWVRLRIVVADESALHAMHGNMGSSGLKICMLCSNVYNWRTWRPQGASLTRVRTQRGCSWPTTH